MRELTYQECKQLKVGDIVFNNDSLFFEEEPPRYSPMTIRGILRMGDKISFGFNRRISITLKPDDKKTYMFVEN